MTLGVSNICTSLAQGWIGPKELTVAVPSEFGTDGASDAASIDSTETISLLGDGLDGRAAARPLRLLTSMALLLRFCVARIKGDPRGARIMPTVFSLAS